MSHRKAQWLWLWALESECLDSDPGLVLIIVGPLDRLFYFSKTQFLNLVCRDNYLLHRVVAKIKQYNLGNSRVPNTW